MALKINNENFAEVKAQGLPTVIDFWATWCGPCRMVAPIIDELAEEYDGKVVIGKCDVEEGDEVAAQFMIHMKVTFVVALILVFPYFIYEIWRFVSPALYSNEKGRRW